MSTEGPAVNAFFPLLVLFLFLFLFTNIPLHETIDIYINQLFENTNIVEGFTKSELNELWRLATKESYFILNGLFYKQTNEVAMGSPIGSFFCFFQPSPFLADEYFFNVQQRRI